MVEQHGKTLVPQIRFAGFTDPWEQRKLGELYQKNDERNTDGLGSERTLSVASMTFNSTGNGADESSLPNYKRLRLGDIAFEGHANKEFAYGRFVLNDAGNGIMSPRFTCLRPIVEQEYSFWKYFIHSEKVMRPILVNSTKSGTMMNELVVEDFLEQEILVPSLPEQRRIGAFFDRLDSLITLHQRKLELLRNIKKSMLDKMFPKGGSLYPEIRFAGFTDPWEQRKLGELCSFSKGCGYSKNNLRDQGTPIILYGRLYTNYETQIHSVDTFVDPLENSVYTEGGEVIVPASGETAEDISIASVVEKPGIILGGDLNIITPSAVVNPVFLALELSYGKPHFDLAKRAQGKSVVHIHNEDIANVFFDRPCIAEQRRIGEFFDRLDTLITLHQRKLELLRNIKKSMLDKMFV
ncbi:restriction endonuclease subunit S [Bifidobacterium pseudocatenulatum]|uniref:restriction endonuclease subunit S n=1 Tax=Bifidobacterium pseudocatenulatum TaxID=28026 RepID=UPI0032EF0DE9